MVSPVAKPAETPMASFTQDPTVSNIFENIREAFSDPTANESLVILHNFSYFPDSVEKYHSSFRMELKSKEEQEIKKTLDSVLRVFVNFREVAIAWKKDVVHKQFLPRCQSFFAFQSNLQVALDNLMEIKKEHHQDSEKFYEETLNTLEFLVDRSEHFVKDSTKCEESTKKIKEQINDCICQLNVQGKNLAKAIEMFSEIKNHEIKKRRILLAVGVFTTASLLAAAASYYAVPLVVTAASSSSAAAAIATDGTMAAVAAAAGPVGTYVHKHLPAITKTCSTFMNVFGNVGCSIGLHQLGKDYDELVEKIRVFYAQINEANNFEEKLEEILMNFTEIRSAIENQKYEVSQNIEDHLNLFIKVGKALHGIRNRLGLIQEFWSAMKGFFEEKKSCFEDEKQNIETAEKVHTITVTMIKKFCEEYNKMIIPAVSDFYKLLITIPERGLQEFPEKVSSFGHVKSIGGIDDTDTTSSSSP